MPCSLGVPLPELALDPVETSSLALLVRVGFVRGEFAGDAVTGDGRGCWCMVAVLCSSPGKGTRGSNVETGGPNLELRPARGV